MLECLLTPLSLLGWELLSSREFICTVHLFHLPSRCNQHPLLYQKAGQCGLHQWAVPPSSFWFHSKWGALALEQRRGGTGDQGISSPHSLPDGSVQAGGTWTKGFSHGDLSCWTSSFSAVIEDSVLLPVYRVPL